MPTKNLKFVQNKYLRDNANKVLIADIPISINPWAGLGIIKKFYIYTKQPLDNLNQYLQILHSQQTNAQILKRQCQQSTHLVSLNKIPNIMS